MEKVNINKASAKELTKIKHVGNVRALKIINHRPFKDIYEISNVAGLGHTRMIDILEQNIITT